MTSTITIKTDKKLKKAAKEYFNGIGLNLSSAVNLFLQDVVQNRAFSISLHDEHYGTLHEIDPSTLSPSVQKEVAEKKDRSGYSEYSL